MDVESAVLIGLLATALFSTIGLLATALFQLRNRIDAFAAEMHREFTDVRTDLAEVRARLDAHVQQSHG